jgi:hypothetical protein
MSAIPEGFSEILRLSPFNALVGPLSRVGSRLAFANGYLVASAGKEQ